MSINFGFNVKKKKTALKSATIIYSSMKTLQASVIITWKYLFLMQIIDIHLNGMKFSYLV